MYATPLFAWSLTTPPVHLLVHAHLVLIGLLFFWPLVGFDPAPVRVPHPARVALLLMILPLHALLAVALMGADPPLGSPVSVRLALAAGVDPVAEQRLGAGILWAGGDLIALVAIAIACYRWWRADTAFTRVGNDRPDGGDDLVRRRWPAVLVTGGGLLAGCTAHGLPEAATTQAEHAASMWRITLSTAAVVGVVTLALILYSVVRFRRRDDSLPDQRNSHLVLEIVCTAIPVAIVAGLFAYTVRTENKVDALAPDPDLVIDVVGYQWGWKFSYRADGVVSVPGQDGSPAVLALPVGATVQLDLVSPDVIHSFWVPRVPREAGPDPRRAQRHRRERHPHRDVDRAVRRVLRPEPLDDGLRGAGHVAGRLPVVAGEQEGGADHVTAVVDPVAVEPPAPEPEPRRGAGLADLDRPQAHRPELHGHGLHLLPDRRRSWPP